ncbi:MAG: histidine phosphatase family protein [Cyanobacteria bacterium]|nr:histidine phosphatase family protein [Cyanobacteriota bacterium]
MAAAELLLLRHGIAEERSPERPELTRALTAKGRQRTREVLERSLALGLAADRMLSSPFTRARQTAEIARAVGLAPALELSESLEPGHDPLPLLVHALAGLAPVSLGPVQPGNGEQRPARLRVLLVGHEPDLGLLAARLLGAHPGAIELRKAGLALLELPAGPTPGSARLRLLLSPRSLLG